MIGCLMMGCLMIGCLMIGCLMMGCLRMGCLMIDCLIMGCLVTSDRMFIPVASILNLKVVQSCMDITLHIDRTGTRPNFPTTLLHCLGADERDCQAAEPAPEQPGHPDTHQHQHPPTQATAAAAPATAHQDIFRQHKSR